MKRALLFSGGIALALTSAWAMAQSSPESLLPPGFERPKAGGAKPAAPAVPSAGSTPVVQPIPGSGGGSASPAARPATLPSGHKIPTLKELESMSPDQLDELLGLKPKFDMPSAARRSMKQVGILAEDEGGMPAWSLGKQSAQLVKATLDGNKGRMVSRWGHILLRRALASRLDAPAGMNPADFAASRAALLVRMGEGEAARQLVQDVDAGNYTPALTQAAMDAYAFTADITGICPVTSVIGGGRKDADWRVLRAICASFQGDGAAGLSQLDQLVGEGGWPQIDILLAQRYAGAAGKARRTVKIEWDGVKDMNPWRYALTLAVGLEPPEGLTGNLPLRYDFVAATAPMAKLELRAKGADRAAGAGILSSAAMVDLYSQIYAADEINGPWADTAQTLRKAYVAEKASDRHAAIVALWDGGADPQARYSRQVLTAYAAARLEPSGDYAKDAPDLIASMLAAGLDQNALRWGQLADIGSLAWGQLALAAPNRTAPVNGSALDSFYGIDASDGYRKSRFLLAGLAGLGRVEPDAARDFAAKLGISLERQTKWTRLIQRAADVNNRQLVILLAGLGMQGDGWDKMTSVNLYHIVSALNRVGLSAEARMIAAEAVARG
ncbi:hypothetical protein [Novosphingobium sp.]|uniref:hypothetical protein n=1 Tax=Novosphingobium sp. TaxID=1874826 RepID=UPI0025DE455F|nr:hypothetical protein [Novosphingobium sp.]MCC6926078.1 hypothetical protein [Novosphingobium sp.]